MHPPGVARRYRNVDVTVMDPPGMARRYRYVDHDVMDRRAWPGATGTWTMT